MEYGLFSIFGRFPVGVLLCGGEGAIKPGSAGNGILQSVCRNLPEREENHLPAAPVRKLDRSRVTEIGRRGIICLQVEPFVVNNADEHAVQVQANAPEHGSRRQTGEIGQEFIPDQRQ